MLTTSVLGSHTIFYPSARLAPSTLVSMPKSFSLPGIYTSHKLGQVQLCEGRRASNLDARNIHWASKRRPRTWAVTFPSLLVVTIVSLASLESHRPPTPSPTSIQTLDLGPPLPVQRPLPTPLKHS